MTDKNAEKRDAIMRAEQAVVDAESHLKLTPQWQAYAAAEMAMQATSTYALLQSRKDALAKLYGEYGEPYPYCEGCGVPFFDDDQYGVDDDGCASCLEGGPCYGKIIGVKTDG